MKITTQRRIFENYKQDKETKINGFNYFIQYHPLALVHTWIIRSKAGHNEWEFLQPLAESIR